MCLYKVVKQEGEIPWDWEIAAWVPAKDGFYLLEILFREMEIPKKAGYDSSAPDAKLSGTSGIRSATSADRQNQGGL